MDDHGRASGDWFAQLLAAVEGRFERAADRWTGFDALDDMVGAWEPPLSVGVIGEAGLGHSSLLLTWACRAAASGRAAVVASDHLPERVLHRRLAAQLAGVPTDALRDGRLTSAAWDRLARARVRANLITTEQWPLRLEVTQARRVADGALVALDIPGVRGRAVRQLIRHFGCSTGPRVGLVVDLGRSPRRPTMREFDVVIRMIRTGSEAGTRFIACNLDVVHNRLGPTGSVDVLFRSDVLQFVGVRELHTRHGSVARLMTPAAR